MSKFGDACPRCGAKMVVNQMAEIADCLACGLRYTKIDHYAGKRIFDIPGRPYKSAYILRPDDEAAHEH